MESNGKSTTWKRVGQGLLLALVAFGLVVAQFEMKNIVLAQTKQTKFQSPAEASTALAKAAKQDDEAALSSILGVDTKVLLSSGDREAEKAALQAFAAKYEKMNRWVDMSNGSRVLYIGADNFAFPVPLVKDSSGQWYFDAVAGAQEIRARDIGRNELLTIDACAAIAAAQKTYFAAGGDQAEYAQRIISTSGKQDGLYWPSSDAQTPSPLASLSEFPRSSLTSLAAEKPLVVDGYSLRILTSQGEEAAGGAKSYIVNGKMSDGFAVLATPVKYGETGIMTFMVGSDGVVYERNLGPDTAKIAASIQQYNPTDDWSAVE